MFFEIEGMIRLLLEKHPVKNIIFGYQFHFGLECHDDVKLDEFCNLCPFDKISNGCYHAGQDCTHICKQEKYSKALDAGVKEKPLYIPMYQRNVQRRIRPLYRQLRDTLLVEIRAIPITNILLGDNHTISLNSQPILKCLLSLQKIGVGSISIWIEKLLPEEEEHWRLLQDPRLLTVSLNSNNINRDKWPLMAFIRYLILLSHLALSGKKVNQHELENIEYLESDKKLDQFLSIEIKNFLERGSFVSVEIDNYPFLFIQYDVKTDKLREILRQNPKDIRLPLCGDKNWRIKTEKVVKASILDADTSSRDSIFWIVNSEGTVKICSSELETSVEESFTATLLETDIVLTMRYFLHVIGVLILRLAIDSLSPSELSNLRHRLFTNLDKYCGIDVSHKDTTKRRIEKIKKHFQIDRMYKGIVDRFDLLRNKLGTSYSLSIERQQTLLTLVFGFFGALNVLYRIFSNICNKETLAWITPLSTWLNEVRVRAGPVLITSVSPDKNVWIAPLFLSLFGAVIVTLVLLIVIRIIRKRIKT